MSILVSARLTPPYILAPWPCSREAPVPRVRRPTQIEAAPVLTIRPAACGAGRSSGRFDGAIPRLWRKQPAVSSHHSRGGPGVSRPVSVHHVISAGPGSGTGEARSCAGRYARRSGSACRDRLGHHRGTTGCSRQPGRSGQPGFSGQPRSGRPAGGCGFDCTALVFRRTRGPGRNWSPAWNDLDSISVVDRRVPLSSRFGIANPVAG